MKTLITGAAGNLGSFLAGHLMPGENELNLLVHNSPLPFQAEGRPNVSVFKADLNDQNSLYPACQDVDCIVHFAGVLFAPRPERFLPRTNVDYFRNLLAAAGDSGVKKVILISFWDAVPHFTKVVLDNLGSTCELFLDNSISVVIYKLLKTVIHRLH